MELGEKLRQARLEAGLSQRQLAQDIVTRNMLSLIENGTAKPSMETLRLLAARLETPVSYFLEEDSLVSPNASCMESARNHFDTGAFGQVLDALADYRSPDPMYDREFRLLQALTRLALAEQAIAQQRMPYALELLQNACTAHTYCADDLERRRLLLLAKASGQKVSARLPSLDGELLLRAEEAFSEGAFSRASRLLDAMEDRSGPDCSLLRGRIHLAEGAFSAAAQCLHRAEPAYPQETAPLLERCYRELEDYKRAYEYACKNR